MTVAAYHEERKVRPCGCVSTCGCESGTGCGLHGELAAQGLLRTRYYQRQIVTPDDLTQDQTYVRDKLRRHNRLLHGWGIVCGLEVVQCDPEDSDDCRVMVTSGFALDPYGNELVLPRDQVLDLCKEDLDGSVACVPQSDPWCRPVDTIPAPCPQYLAVRHVERPSRPVHAPHGCSCRDASCENSRIEDGLEFKILTEKPSHYDRECGSSRVHFCREVGTCPECPKTGWVILAEVCLEGTNIAELDPSACRRHVFSTAHICIDCSDDIYGPQVVTGRAVKRYVGSATPQPDAVMTVNAVIEGHIAEVSVALKQEDVAGANALEVKSLLDKVMLFDAADSSAEPFNAGMLISHSPLEADWVFANVDDLELRLRTPVFSPAEYKSLASDVERLLDQPGRDAFKAALGNPARLDELDIVMINGISEPVARRLRGDGVTNLAALRETEAAPEPATANANAKRVLAETRDLMRRLGTQPPGSPSSAR